MIKQEAETFKGKNENLDETTDKFSKSHDYDQNNQIMFGFEFFTGVVNPKFNLFVKKFGLTNENIKFVDFLQSDYCKEILQSNDLKIHIEIGNIYYDDTDTSDSIFDFMKNQQNSSKRIINSDLKYDGSYKIYFQQ